MTNSLSTDGAKATEDDKTLFSIKVHGSSATVTPTHATQLYGWINFTIPNPDKDANMKSVSVDFSSVQACVSTVAVYIADSQVFKSEYLSNSSSFTLPTPSEPAVDTRNGISVSIRVEFYVIAANIKVQSVSIGI